LVLEIGTTEIFLIVNIGISLLTLIVLILQTKRLIGLFTWVLDYLLATKETKNIEKKRDCPKCNKSLMEHSIVEARQHGIAERWLDEMKKAINNGDKKTEHIN